MEKHIDVMKRTLDLSDTVLEGLHHVQKLLHEGKAEQTLILFGDILNAYATISQTTEPIFRKLNKEVPQSHINELNKASELIVTAYEEKSYGTLQEILQFTFIPNFKRFQEVLETTFTPYLVS